MPRYLDCIEKSKLIDAETPRLHRQALAKTSLTTPSKLEQLVQQAQVALTLPLLDQGFGLLEAFVELVAFFVEDLAPAIRGNGFVFHHKALLEVQLLHPTCCQACMLLLQCWIALVLDGCGDLPLQAAGCNFCIAECFDHLVGF